MVLARHHGFHRGALGAALLAALLLAVGLLLFVAPAATAAPLPGEPTVEVTVWPADVPVDASGINPVDTTFLVNVSGRNLGPRPHTMWVNMSFSSDTGWKVSPALANFTFALPAMGDESDSVSVTMTVPPGVSANNVATFSASFVEENDLRFSQGDSGNRTAQVHILQIFSTSAEFNGTSQFTIQQGQDANYTVRVTNRGNGDATYDAQLLNAGDLQSSDVVLKSTASAIVPINGTGLVRVVIHANPTAIPGPYQIQIRVLATSAGATPPPGAFADLTGFLNVQSRAPPPPPTNNTTTPPPPVNNTTGGGNNPPPGGSVPGQFSFGDALGMLVTQPLLMLGVVIFAVLALIIGWFVRRTRKLKRAREAARERMRGARPMGQGPGPRPVAPGMRPVAPGPRVAPGRPVPASARPASARPSGAVRPIRRDAGPK